MFGRIRRTIADLVMPPVHFFAGLLQKATTAQGYRSTVLRPLGWLTGLCISAVLVAVELKAPGWILVLFAVFAILSVILYLFSYVYCLFTDREALRSEKYSIQKMAIQKGFIGDSLAGVFSPESGTTNLLESRAKEAGA